MKRLLRNNINTPGFWNQVYLTNPFIQLDRYRYGVIGMHIERKPCKVVDLGCGNGLGDFMIREACPDAKITGVDFHNPHLSLFENFVEGDVCKTGLPDNSFDYVVSSETLEHLSDPEALFSEAARLLNASGRLILTTPYMDHVPSEEHVWEFDISDIEKMLKGKFSNYWVTPWASGRCVRNTKTGKTVYETGNWDTIWVLAIK